MDADLMYAEGEIASLDAQLATAHADLARLRAQTERLTVFVAAWREIEALYGDERWINAYPNESMRQAVTLTIKTAQHFQIDPQDVRAAGRVIKKLLSE